MAINFPSTAGQAVDGTFTYVVAGITYSWNGESWTAAGSGATATDRTVFSATNASASGGGSLAYNFNDGVFTFTPPDLSSYLTSTGVLNTHTDVNHGTPTDGDVLAWNQSNLKWENTAAGTGGGLDADKLDGQEGSYYLNSTNQNAGTLPAARLSGSYSISIDGSAGSLASLSDVGNVVETTLTTGQVLSYNGSNWVNADAPSVRQTISYTATGIQDNVATNISITTPKTYALLKMETSHAVWATLYADTTSRTNDSARSETTDPVPGSGVLAEIVTTGATTQLISPGTVCFNSGGANTTYAKIVNKSGSQVNLQITLTLVPLES
jgi:hypothetical protein